MAEESFSVGGKASKAVWQTVGAILLVLVGGATGASVTAAKAPEPFVDHTPEVKAKVAEVANQVTATKADADRSRADIAQALNGIAAVQAKQAETLSELRASVARIEGRLETAAAKRR